MLCNAMINGRLPHALLFTGEDGVGKATAALELARICNCSRAGTQESTARQERTETSISACGKCRSCRKIDSGVHPDIHVVSPSGTYIRIDQIRGLYSSLVLKSDSAVTRFVLVEDAHLMNQEAGNALLKILEEPPDSTVFVLTAPGTRELLSTVVSRCRHIRFNPIPQKELSEHLVSHYGIDGDRAMILASIARGSLSRAVEMAGADWIAYRNFIVETICQLPELPSAFKYAFAEILAADRDKLEGAFEIMKNWYRDLAVFSCSPQNIYNHDMKQRVRQAAAPDIDPDLIIEKADAVLSAERAILRNANPRLALDALMTKLAQNRHPAAEKRHSLLIQKKTGYTVRA